MFLGESKSTLFGLPKVDEYLEDRKYLQKNSNAIYGRPFSEYHFLSFEASVVILTEYSKLRREGAEHILLSNKGRNLCVCCLFAFLLCRQPFIQSTSRVEGVLLQTQGSAESILVQYGHATRSELINNRTA